MKRGFARGPIYSGSADGLAAPSTQTPDRLSSLEDPVSMWALFPEHPAGIRRVRAAMILLHIQDYYHPELGYQETFMMREQVAAGHEVHIITSDRQHYTEIAMSPVRTGNYLEERIQVHRLPCRFGFLQRSYRLWLRGLEDEITKVKPDWVLVHGMQSLTAYRVARAHNLPEHQRYKLLFDSHAAYFNSMRKGRKLFYAIYRRCFANSFMKNADAIVAIDNWSKEFLVSECGIRREVIEIIPLAADSCRFQRDPNARARVRSEWDVREDQVVFIYLGKVLRSKGVHFLVDAALKMKDTFTNFAVVILGSGDYEYLKELKEKSLGRGDVRFLFLPHVDNCSIPEVYSAADVSVWPASISIGTLEAQACGVPLIVNDLPVAVDRIRHGNGVCYRIGNVDDLTEKMEYLARNAGPRRDMAERGRKAIEEGLNWAIVTDEFMRVVGMRLT